MEGIDVGTNNSVSRTSDASATDVGEAIAGESVGSDGGNVVINVVGGAMWTNCVEMVITNRCYTGASDCGNTAISDSGHTGAAWRCNGMMIGSESRDLASGAESAAANLFTFKWDMEKEVWKYIGVKSKSKKNLHFGGGESEDETKNQRANSNLHFSPTLISNEWDFLIHFGFIYTNLV